MIRRNLCFLFLLLTVATATPLAAAVTKGNTSSAQGTTASLAWSHTLAAASDRVTVGTGMNTIAGASGVTYGASSMTLVRRDSHASVGTTEIWEISGVSTSETITVTLPSSQNVIAGAVDWDGADTPDNATGRLIDTETSSSLTVTGDASGNFIFDVIFQRNGALTVGADQNEEWNLTQTQESGGSTQAGADGGVMSWSWSSSDDGAHTACRIPASAVTTPTPRRRVVVIQ